MLSEFITGLCLIVCLVLLNKGDNSKLSGSAAASGSASVDSPTAPSAGADSSSVASVSSPPSTASSSHLSSAPAPPPQLSKVTAFEFMQAWNGLKGTIDIEQYVNVLDQIQPADIPKGTSVMSCQLYIEFFCMHLDSLHA